MRCASLAPLRTVPTLWRAASIQSPACSCCGCARPCRLWPPLLLPCGGGRSPAPPCPPTNTVSLFHFSSPRTAPLCSALPSLHVRMPCPPTLTIAHCGARCAAGRPIDAGGAPCSACALPRVPQHWDLVQTTRPPCPPYLHPLPTHGCPNHTTIPQLPFALVQPFCRSCHPPPPAPWCLGARQSPCCSAGVVPTCTSLSFACCAGFQLPRLLVYSPPLAASLRRGRAWHARRCRCPPRGVPPVTAHPAQPACALRSGRHCWARHTTSPGRRRTLLVAVDVRGVRSG